MVKPYLTKGSVSLDGIKHNSRTLLACGADVKNRFSFCKEGKLYLSSDNGNLAQTLNYNRYLAAVEAMSRSYGLSPDFIVVDKHPSYFSSGAAALFPEARRIEVQHHHAHVAGILAYQPQRIPVIGVSFDGTGYGDDGALWGGEFFVVSDTAALRKAHFEYLPMPGGEKAVYEPWRMAFSLAYTYLGERIFEKNFDFLRQCSANEKTLIPQLLRRKVNTPLTSSCGRLFDAVSSLAGITHRITFEAEAAIRLEEAAAESSDPHAYPFEIKKEGTTYRIGYRPFLEEMLRDIETQAARSVIARRFHNAVARLIKEVVSAIGEENGTTTVVLCGGVFQNRILSTSAACFLKEAGYNVLEVPHASLNDLGICVGQTFVALNRLNDK